MKNNRKYLLLASFLLMSCGSGSGGGGGGPILGGTTTGGGPGTPPPSGCGSSATVTVCVNASNASLPADSTSTSTITATVTENGAPVPDGTTINFAATLGTVSASTALTTGGTGAASVVFTAGSTTGAAVITASYSGVNGPVSINLGTVGPSAGGIQFLSANPSVIGIQNAGQITTSTVRFAVTDATGTPVPNANVNFVMTGPGGGEYIGSPDSTPTLASGTSASNGDVSVILNSGTVAGPVTVTASVTVAAGTFSASSSVISIGGGISSATHFTLVSERLNLPGWLPDGGVAGFETTITAYLADRFSNFNVLQGTSVSFFTEAGAIDTGGAVDATGATSVTFRTQNPMPQNVTTLPQPQANGWVTVIAMVRGEESFVDVDGNGVYNPAVDQFLPAFDLGEPFIDADDNGQWDVGEFYFDDNSNSQYDGPNGVWDGPECTQAGCRASPLIWTTLRLMFTGNLYCSLTPGNFAITDGGSQQFTITVADINGNMPSPGTTVAVSKTGAGNLVGQASFTVPDGIGGPFTKFVRLFDASPGTAASPAEQATVTLRVTVPGSETVTCDQEDSVGTVE